MIKFKDVKGMNIWINPDKVVLVHEFKDINVRNGAKIVMQDGHAVVRESPEEVTNLLEWYKELQQRRQAYWNRREVPDFAWEGTRVDDCLVHLRERG